MTEPQAAKTVVLTDPSPGVFMLGTQIEGEEFRQITINRDQLLKLNHETADVLRRAFRS